MTIFVDIPPRDTDLAQDLYRAVRKALEPFRFSEIRTMVDYDIDWMEDRLIVEVFSVDGKFMLPHTENFIRNDLTAWAETTMLDLCEKFFNYYRFNRPTAPIPSNIILGES